MSIQTIEVEELPEGWKAVAYRVPKGNIEFVFIENVVREAKPQDKKCLIIEKIQPRRIVLEDTEEERSVSYGDWFEDNDGTIGQWPDNQYGSQESYKVWREVKETNEESHLKLTKKDMLELIEHIKLGGQLNPKIAEFIDYEQTEPKLNLSVDECKSIVYAPIDLYVKLEKFIKENS